MRKIPPVVIVIASFVTAILVGTLLLSLPFATQPGKSISFIDSFFISTSAICVTGLTTIPNIAETFSLFGKIVLGILIQIGGLGIITISSFFFLVIGAKIGIGNRYILKVALNQEKVTDVLKLLKSIIKITFIVEFVGACLNLIVFSKYYDIGSAIGISIFHAISSFNNAGFDILGDRSLLDYSSNILLNVNTMILIVIGGLGFIVIKDLFRNKFKFTKLQLHSKIVINMTLMLIVGGTLMLKLSMGSNITWLEAIFSSITARTAGFATVSMVSLNSAAAIIMMVLMLIGASPASTGGGIKTTTFYTLVKSMTSFAVEKPTVVSNRKIGEDTKLKAFVLFFYAIGMIIMASIFIFIFEKNNPFISFENVLFESVSAFATVGLSMGITAHLATASKIVIILLMFVGRLGPITMMSVWSKSWNKPNVNNVDYIEEKIIIG